ncbi:MULTISPECIES: transthyretin-like family protein [unclassified Desulfurobacterium]|uniref:hypothetical protein n=1 Tax=Desulfurobacterium sp. TC5-1 TaxID=1158318 RepID=UPI0003B4A4F8|nr:hypothetical protein [Desulfurobacterium sp. TC5-1]
MKKLAILIFIFLLSMTSAAFAHKISVFADVDNGKVNIMGYFSDGTPCKNSEVKVYDAKTGKLLLTGKTDKEGNFSFKPPKITDLKIVVNAELGHRAETIVPASELSGSENSDISTESSAEENQTAVSVKTQESTFSSNPTISKEELQKLVEKAVNKAVDRELKPIHQELLGIEMALTKPSIAEIFGGIGWIFGLFGTAAYFYSRKEKDGK